MTNSETSTRDRSGTVIDPVCGMSVVPGATKLVSIHEGRSYWFCAEGCREAFEANPGKYLDTKKTRRKGWFSRYLARMAKANQEEFGCSGPKCH